jgi:hypothetical protein
MRFIWLAYKLKSLGLSSHGDLNLAVSSLPLAALGRPRWLVVPLMGAMVTVAVSGSQARESGSLAFFGGGGWGRGCDRPRFTERKLVASPEALGSLEEGLESGLTGQALHHLVAGEAILAAGAVDGKGGL